MSTLTLRFPYRVAMGFEGGSAYNTSIAMLPSGRQKRNANMSNSLGRWVATQLHKTEAPTQELIKYFHAAQGRTHNFPFRDWTDYKVLSGEGTLVLVAVGSYQLYKQYVIGGITRTRKIIRPINAVVAGGGVYSVAATTGLLTHSSGAAPTGWTGQFDCLCRFDNDALDGMSIIDKRGDGQFIYTWGNIAIQEDRL